MIYKGSGETCDGDANTAIPALSLEIASHQVCGIEMDLHFSPGLPVEAPAESLDLKARVRPAPTHQLMHG